MQRCNVINTPCSPFHTCNFRLPHLLLGGGDGGGRRIIIYLRRSTTCVCVLLCCFGLGANGRRWLGSIAAVDTTKLPVMPNSPVLSHTMGPERPDKQARLEGSKEVRTGQIHHHACAHTHTHDSMAFSKLVAYKSSGPIKSMLLNLWNEEGGRDWSQAERSIWFPLCWSLWGSP